MHERDLYPEIEHTIDCLGGYWKKTQDLRFENKAGQVVEHTEADATKKAPKRGDVDFCWVFRTGKSALVEVKYKRFNFPFAEIKPEQRDVLNNLSRFSWLWLFMGDRINGRDWPRKAWLVPWLQWLGVEEEFRSFGLEGMAHTTPHKKEHRELGLSAVETLRQWELNYTGGKLPRWNFPDSHPIWPIIRTE